MGLPNFTFNPYVKPYVGGIANELGQVVQAKTQQFYQNAEQDDVLGYQADTLKNLIMDNPNDQAYADQILNQTRTELTDRAQRGDYENMFREVKRSARKFSANVAPLLQRKQQYDSYIKSMSEELGKGTWGRDTYSKAIQLSKDQDKGYNPKDPTTLAFRGFQPTKDESAAEIVNKFFGNDFKGSKTVRQFFNPKTMTMDKLTFEDSGDYVKGVYIDKNGEINTKEEGRPITRIELAGRQHLTGDKNFQNYVDTQNQLGNIGRVKGEVDAALQAEVQKLGITIDMQESDIGGVPMWMKMLEEKANSSKEFEATSAGTSENKLLNPGFRGLMQSPDGSLQRDTNFAKANGDGSYTEYTDPNGNQLSLADIADLKKKSPLSNYNKGEGRWNEIKITGEKAAKLNKETNQEFTKYLQSVYLADYNMQNVPLKQQKEFLEKYRFDWDTPKYRNKVWNNFNKDLEDFAVIEPGLWTQRYYGKTVNREGLNVPETTDSNILTRNLEGKRVKLLTNPLGLELEGKESMNDIFAELKDKGWVFDGNTSQGLLKINPTAMKTKDGGHTLPGIGTTISVHKGEGADRQNASMQVAVGIGSEDKKPFLQLLQDVGDAYLSVGNGVKVIPTGFGKAAFVVTNISGRQLKQNVPFVGFVQYRDTNGNLEGKPKPIGDWQDWYIEQHNVKEEANSFLLNK